MVLRAAIDQRLKRERAVSVVGSSTVVPSLALRALICEVNSVAQVLDAARLRRGGMADDLESQVVWPAGEVQFAASLQQIDQPPADELLTPAGQQRRPHA